MRWGLGKSRGRRQERRLADMSEPIEAKIYKPPPPGACEVMVYPVEITPTDRITVRQHIYRGKVVDFAIMQEVREGEIWHHVARIDCCHGTIHRHQFTRDGQDIYGHRVIREITGLAGEGWDVVDDTYDMAQEAMFNEYEDNLRRWRDGS